MLEQGLPDKDPRWRQVVGGDKEALNRIKPYAGLVRDDHVDMPMVREPSRLIRFLFVRSPTTTFV